MTQNTQDQRQLMAILSRLSGRPEENIAPELPLFGKGLGLDSVSGVALMTALEEEFGITLDDIDLHMEALDSVGNLLKLVGDPTRRPKSWARQLEQVATAARLHEGRAGVERVIGQVAASPGLTSRELAARCSLPTPVVAAVRKELARAGLLEEAGKGARLTGPGEEIARGLRLGVDQTTEDPAETHRARRSPLFPELVERLTPLLEQRPKADFALDQAKSLPETTAARALLALDYGVLLGKRVAFVGDDDFTAVGLAILGQMMEERGAAGPTRLTVLDIDKRILSVMGGLADQYGYPVEPVEYDARLPVPKQLVGTHDAFFTDPPYTVAGARLFVSRGVELCRPAGFLAFFSFANKGPREMLEVHRAMVEIGLLVREVVPRFNRYEGASLWGNQSQMIVFEGTDVARSVESGEYGGPLYTREFRKRG